MSWFKKMFMTKKAIIIWIIIIISSAGGYYYYMEYGQPVVSVEAYKTDVGEVRETFEEIAEVKVMKNNFVYSETAAKLIRFDIEIGDRIKKGDVLAVFDSQILELEIEGLKYEIEALNSSYLEALKSADRNAVNQARAHERSAKAAYEESKRTYENNKALNEQGVVSKEVVTKSENLMNISEEQYNAAKSAVGILTKSVSENIKNRYEAQISALEARLEIMGNQLVDMVIYVERDGIVLDKFVDRGEFLVMGQPLIEFDVEKNLVLKSDILTTDSMNIQEGTKVILEDEDNAISFDGTVSMIYPKAFDKISDLGIVQKRVTVEIDIDEVDDLPIGYELDAKFIVISKENVVRIPERCIFELDDTKNVFIIKEGVINLKEVSIGLEGEEFVEIVEGLQTDDIVVLSPEDELEDGILVEYEIRK